MTLSALALACQGCATAPGPREYAAYMPLSRQLAQDAPAERGWSDASLAARRQDAPAPSSASSSSSKSAPSGPRFAEGFSVGVYAAAQTLSGDFDGASVLVSPVDLIVLPDFDSGLGLGVSMGLKTSGGALDLYFESLAFDGDFGGLELDAELANFGIRGRFVPGRFDAPTQRWQPYFLWGLALNLLTIEDGSTDGVSVGDGDLTGFSGELGGGLLYNVSHHVAFRLDLGYRWTRFGSADGVAGSGTLDDSVKGDGAFGALGVAYTF
jgi:opacity protein-like surface antigen